MAAIETEMVIIRDCLAAWVTQVRLANAINYYDINRISEGMAVHLLNLVYGYSLEDLNREQNNFPGVDLGDRITGIAVQVTSRTDTAKMMDTLQLFSNEGYAASFPNGVRFFIVNDRKNWRIAPEKLKPYGDIFDIKANILFVSNLLTDIQNIYYQRPEHFSVIKASLQKEFGATSQHESLLNHVDTASQLKFFRRIYQATHEQAVERFVGFSCSFGSEIVTTEELPSKVSQTAITVIVGASGYGKTLLAKRLSLELLDRALPLFLRAKFYETDLESLFNKEALAYGFANARAWLAAAKAGGLMPLVIIDGFNECGNAFRPKLLTELEELITHYSVRIMITVQVVDEGLETLDPSVITISAPEQKTKVAIAGLYSGKTVNKKLQTVLNVVKSNIEAQMVGEIGTEDIDQVSRFRVFELFVRRKLDDLHADGLRLLSAVAGVLSGKLSFHLPERLIDELMREENISIGVLDRCLKTGLLDIRMGMYSFGHEMFFNFFVAENIAASASSSAAIIDAINSPRHQDSLLLIVGAITDIEQLVQVLPSVTDFELFISLWHGEGGTFSQQWTDRELRRILQKIGTEISRSEFELLKDHPATLDFKKDYLLQWTPHDYALLYALSGLLVQGVFLNEFYELTGQMDEKCSHEQTRLYEEAKAMKIGLRSSLFSATYIGTHTRGAAMTRIFSDLYSGMATFNRARSVTVDMVKPLLNKKSLCYGEFYLLLLLLRWTEGIRCLYPYILSSLQKNWRSIPYHLTIEILQQAPHACTDEERRQELIDALNQMHSETQNIWLSTSIFEALSGLGALADDADAYIETVQLELADILTSANNEKTWDRAAGFYYAQFDHPYDSAYYQVVSNLQEPNRKTFYMMALQGFHSSIFTISLIRQAWDIYGRAIAPYLVRWTETPFLEVSFPQDSLATFFISHLLLAKSCYVLVSRLNSADDAKNRSLFAAAELLYWLNREDIQYSDRVKAASMARYVLFGSNNIYAVETIWQSRYSLHNTGIHRDMDATALMVIIRAYKQDIVAICRKAISAPGSQQDVMGFPRPTEIESHAISLLAECGSLIDLDILRPLADHPAYGRDAVRAIKKLSEDYI